MEVGFTGTLTQTGAFTITCTDSTVNFSIDAGTFVGGSGDITTTRFLMTAGSFTSTSGTLTITASGVNFDVTGGVWIHNSGTITFSTSTTDIFMVSPSTNKFFNLQTNNSGNWSTANTIRVANTLTLRNANGFLGGGTIEVEGNVDATFTAGSTYSGITIKFLGSGDQTFTGVAGGARTPAVNVSKPSGTLFLVSFLRIQGAWTWVSGAGQSPGTSKVQFSSFNIDTQYQEFNDVEIATGGNCTLLSDMQVLGNLDLGSINQLNGFRIDVSGDVTAADTTFGSGDTTEVRLVGSANQTIGGTSNRWYKFFSIDKTGGTASLLSNMRVDNVGGSTFTLIRGTLDLAGFNLTVSSAPAILTDGVLRMQGTETVTPAPAFSVGSSCVLYGTPGPTSVPNFTYANLTTEGTGIFTQTAAKAIGGALNINNSTTWRTAGFTLTAASGLFVNSTATLEVSGAETLTVPTLSSTSTVIYSGAGAFPSLIAGNSYANVRFNNAGGSWAQTANITVSGNLTITAGTLVSGGFNVDLSGNWSNSGTYMAGAGTVNLVGTNQSILGSTTFNNLSKVIPFATGLAQILTFDNLGSQVIAGTWTAQGGMNARLSLVSDVPGMQWDIDPQGTRSIFRLSVTDSNNVNAGAVIATGTDSVDGGNNTNWTFGGTGVAKRGFRVGRVRV